MIMEKIVELKRLKKAYLIALEFDYVPINTVENVEKISNYIGIFEICILDKFRGLNPDEIVNRIITVIDKL